MVSLQYLRRSNRKAGHLTCSPLSREWRQVFHSYFELKQEMSPINDLTSVQIEMNPVGDTSLNYFRKSQFTLEHIFKVLLVLALLPFQAPSSPVRGGLFSKSCQQHSLELRRQRSHRHVNIYALLPVVLY